MSSVTSHRPGYHHGLHTSGRDYYHDHSFVSPSQFEDFVSLTPLVNADERLPDYIRAMVKTLRDRKADWKSAPGALQAEDDAEEDERYDDAGYTTEYDASEASDEDLNNDSPLESGSPVSSSDDVPPVVSSDDDLDSLSPLEAGSPVYGSGSESDEFDSDQGV
ncbi:hypothetical protein BU24DRAFT_409969 [Aaosphaeria arxii CBS 175.79]|uniref:Uncharacterized protein n=1 Tax=Aaosphaeria arxii CBS 175.79 TaxID=1450172 RepID=A0A6A5XLQ8_9PLEO|nr:uncharacterized protein BU24DRAFT_409969 [Aaosphaeria arxii CBS 175.79]KAF2014208.1 hypothetical protein BU24DRAFT_409969 [Aaosphaeria arxii CBS 175.79]